MKYLLGGFAKYIKKYSLELIVLGISSSLFLMDQINKVEFSGIGTDEGNFLYLIKLLKEGSDIFTDLYSRESGALLLLYPYFHFFDLNIENLRYFIILIHLITILFLYLTLKNLSKNDLVNSLILVISVIIMSYGGPLEIYNGVFYQLFGLFSAVLLYLTTTKESFGKYVLAGALTGLSIITYKGAQVFLLLIPLWLYLKTELGHIYFKAHLLFFTSVSVVIISYFLYYGLKHQDFLTIYSLILSDVILNFIIAFLLTFIGFFLINARLKNTPTLVALTNVFYLFGIFYQTYSNPTSLLAEQFYGGLILQFSFLLILFQITSLSLSGVYMKSMAAGYILSNILLLYFGYGFRAFFTNVPDPIHMSATTIFVIYNLIMTYFLFKPSKSNEFNYQRNNHLIYIFLILSCFFIITSFYGGYLMPTRFSTVLIFLPILLFISYKFINSAYLNKTFAVIVFVSMLFSMSINLNLKNDFTLYTTKEFDAALNFLNSKNINEHIIFSADTALLAETNQNNIIKFYSPWQFSTPDADVCKGTNITNTLICMRYNDILPIVENNHPEYIFGSWRHTMRLFDTPTGNEFLEREYLLIQSIGPIDVYARKN